MRLGRPREGTAIWLAGLCWLATLALAACHGSKEVPEAGAVLLRFEMPEDATPPTELRLSVWDDDGVLWQDARIPADGALPAPSHGALGTFLLQPGATRGALRLHARALMGSTRILEGALTIAPADRSRGTFAWRLETAALADGDGDGVPDVIDDCPAKSNAQQGGCPADVPGADGGADGAVTTADAEADVTLADGGERDLPAERGAGADGLDRDANARDGELEDLRPQDASEREATADTRVEGDASIDAAVDQLPPRDAAGEAPPACAFPGGCNLTVGTQCQDDGQCQSAFCADGVCCNSACTGNCRSCNLPGKEGSCQGYAAGTDPERECTGGLLCNGAGACGNTSPPGTKGLGDICGKANECGSGFCKDGVCCNTACNGACQICSTGTCKAVTKGQDPPECPAPMRCNPSGRCTD